jgi:phenylalanyl-tRNA synthetase beta chain
MKISYNWLQKYFEEKLPEPKKLADIFTMHSFEIESVDEVVGDVVFDIKVLPNRSHDCLSHRGVASELKTLLNLNSGTSTSTPTSLSTFSRESALVKMDNLEPELCKRVTYAILKVKVGNSPAWLREKLEAIGQKPINNIVDALNYVMFDLGQPMHAFDLDKISNNILIKKLDTEALMLALDNKTYKLPAGTLVHVDAENQNILDIAGIKGGKVAEIDQNTKTVLVEALSFKATEIRKNAKAIGIRTDASTRFENGISAALTTEAISEVVRLLADMDENSLEVVELIDQDFDPESIKAKRITLSTDRVRKILGVEISDQEIIDILIRVGCGVETADPKAGDAVIIVTPPVLRLDLEIEEDLIEEVGRVYGFFKIIPIQPEVIKQEVVIPDITIVTEIISEVLISLGYDEVYTYAFREKGEVEVANPLASDKAFLRDSLSAGLEKSISLNEHNAPLLGIREMVKIFEIGTVFKKDPTNKEKIIEKTVLSIGLKLVKKMKNSGEFLDNCVKEVEGKLSESLGSEIKLEKISENVYEVELLESIRPRAFASQALFEPALRSPKSLARTSRGLTTFKRISPFPFMLRDIAVFTPQGTTEDDVLEVILKESGELLKTHTLFDVFEKKDGQGNVMISYAFNLVFQSNEKTLSDAEINVIMDNITADLHKKAGFIVR